MILFDSVNLVSPLGFFIFYQHGFAVLHQLQTRKDLNCVAQSSFFSTTENKMSAALFALSTIL